MCIRVDPFAFSSSLSSHLHPHRDQKQNFIGVPKQVYGRAHPQQVSALLHPQISHTDLLLHNARLPITRAN